MIIVYLFTTFILEVAPIIPQAPLSSTTNILHIHVRYSPYRNGFGCRPYLVCHTWRQISTIDIWYIPRLRDPPARPTFLPTVPWVNPTYHTGNYTSSTRNGWYPLYHPSIWILRSAFQKFIWGTQLTIQYTIMFGNHVQWCPASTYIASYDPPTRNATKPLHIV